MCEKSDEGETESIIFICVLSSFLSVKSFVKIWANQFSFRTCKSFKSSFLLFLTIEANWQLDSFFSLSACFEQLNTAKNLALSKFLFHFHLFVFYTLFIIFLHSGIKNIHVRKAWLVTCIRIESNYIFSLVFTKLNDQKSFG